jgi:hypothetical protein
MGSTPRGSFRILTFNAFRGQDVDDNSESSKRRRVKQYVKKRLVRTYKTVFVI